MQNHQKKFNNIPGVSTSTKQNSCSLYVSTVGVGTEQMENKNKKFGILNIWKKNKFIKKQNETTTMKKQKGIH